ncbi:YegP family protein [Ovoidimarina sediminis]|uniref:YegP family protein n=1 Tax=Ovoidimarina sediminis TaxID=3079856 RepID=UPI00291025AE|nr:YegP family protein [Rhodophyticola sp. MJ-SS7]MDU8944782.1 YegP family protein [Rhodophyticola sp. MJ-SS7]
MAGKFEVFTDKAGEFRFRLKAGNGQIILASEGYKKKASAMNGIESVRKNSQEDKRFERTETKNGKARFNLKASNGQVIGTSETYESVKARDNGIASVAKNAPDAKVVDTTAG